MREDRPTVDAAAGDDVTSGKAEPESTECEAASPSETLGFEKDMWERFDFVLERCVGPSELLMESVAEALKSRAQLERQYGKQLITIPKQIPDSSQGGSVRSAVNAIMVNFRNRGEQSIELAEQIELDIVTTFEDVLKQHRDVCKRIQADVHLLVKHVQSTRKVHSRMALRYGTRCHEAEVVAQESVQNSGMKPSDRIQLAKRATTLSLQARVVEAEYYASIDQANKAWALYEQHMSVVLSCLQELEEKRATCLRDGLRKLAVYETSWLRNLQYDLEDAVKAAEASQPLADLQAFIRQNLAAEAEVPKTPSRGEPQFGVQAFWLLSKPKPAKETPELALQKKLRADEGAMIRQMIETELQALIQRLIQESALSEGDQEGVSRLRQGLRDICRRVALCQALRMEVMRGEVEGADLHSAKPVCVHQGHFNLLVSIFSSALDACDEQNDAWCGRDIMVLSQLFQTEGAGGKSVLLGTKVYDHVIWNKVTFWEEVLVVGLCEAHSAEALWRRQLPPGSLFNQPAMTAFLQRFVGYMQFFGIRFDQAKSSVLSTLRKHVPLLGTAAASYETLLLQGYQAQSAPNLSAAAEAPRTLEEGNGDGYGGEAQETSDLHAVPSAGDDDFEALALGLPSSDIATDAAERSTSVDALRSLETSQRSVAEVFT